MGRILNRGSLPPDDKIFSGGVEMFSRLGSSPSSKTSPGSTRGQTPAEQPKASAPTKPQPSKVASPRWTSVGSMVLTQ